jgi:tRNA-specific 2-thiouridylase
LRKEETRALAAKFNLATAEKPDSQDICFVPTGGYAAVIEKIRPGAAEPGEIVHVDGRVLGAHAGIIHYTVGQRKGLGGGSGEPLYVVKLDAKNKRVVVGPKQALARDQFHIKELNWFDTLDARDGIRVKMRSAQTPVVAAMQPASAAEANIRLATAYEGIAPGQACVIYDGDRVLGGGWISAD